MPVPAMPGRGRGRAATTPRGHPAHGGQPQAALDRPRYRDRARSHSDCDRSCPAGGAHPYIRARITPQVPRHLIALGTRSPTCVLRNFSRGGRAIGQFYAGGPTTQGNNPAPARPASLGALVTAGCQDAPAFRATRTRQSRGSVGIQLSSCAALLKNVQGRPKPCMDRISGRAVANGSES